MDDNSINHIDRKGLETKFRELGITVKTTEHPEVYTVEQALPHISHLEGVFAKNLFLKDKKKKLYLFCAPHNVDIKLSDLAKLVGATGGLRFADENILQEKLGIKQGSVTVFGLINDTNHDVKLIMDRRLTDDTYSELYFHPMVNSASCGITPTDLIKFVEHTGHEPLLVDI
ncbi:hypothetical protein ACJMK2_036388 [Sinanodonta woodiana]|uniref:PrdX deacylase domain-containing protein 1 n=1 Tax=Sinanodonta woodiana TaxID=1069815 RepID=A0ABD3WKF1_SINWO